MVGLSRYPGPEAIKPMREAEIGTAVQLLDLMLGFFTGDAHWTRGRYDDGHGGHCLVGALLHLSREHRLPSAPAITLTPNSAAVARQVRPLATEAATRSRRSCE